ncbi:penicillin-binding protein 1C [Endothiovibrio diazotrophicus]
MKRRSLALLTLLPALLITALALDRAFPPDLSRLHHPAQRVTDRHGATLRVFTSDDGYWRFPADPSRVDPRFLELLLNYEDRRFPHHPGVDPLALLRAVGQWLAHGEVVSGASTLTMQTARLLEPRPRTLANKLREMLRALQLEWRYDKPQILAAYLTLAPYGGNLEGIEAASLAWFGHPPNRLTAARAALLVVLPQAPSRLRPDRFPHAARQARDKVLRRARAAGLLDDRELREALAEPLPAHRHPMPFLAPHLARRLRDEGIEQASVDATLQAQLEGLLRRRGGQLAARAGVAALVVDNHSREVLAYVGGSDFFDAERAGQVDLVRAVRSPGSTLKPFIYGLAFEAGLIHPETLVDDRPQAFGDYRPGSFDGRYRGEVSVRSALQQSLNIPAVEVLERLGPQRLVSRLAEAGVPLADGGERPGLAIALGGTGTRLEELVALYADLADGGRAAPLRLTPGTTRPQGRLLGETATWYVSDILHGAARPPDQINAAYSERHLGLAYKTGTSYGFRDAWAIGYNRDYTVGIWSGRPDGSPNPGHYGYNTAAPLLFAAFDLLPGSGDGLPEPPPEVLFAGNRELPPLLQRLDGAPPRLWVDAPAPHIDFPPDGAELAWRPTLGLQASGGRRPLRWLVNGRPLESSPLRREALWQPRGRGLNRIVVVDGDGRSSASEVWLD